MGREKTFQRTTIANAYIDRPGRICHNLGTPSGSIGLKTSPRTKEQVRESGERRG